MSGGPAGHNQSACPVHADEMTVRAATQLKKSPRRLACRQGSQECPGAPLGRHIEPKGNGFTLNIGQRRRDIANVLAVHSGGLKMLCSRHERWRKRLSHDALSAARKSSGDVMGNEQVAPTQT